MKHIYDVIIIGGGPAGYCAALYAVRAGLNSILIEQIGPGGQMALTGDIDNYPGFEEGIDGFTLGMKMQQCAERFGAVSEYAKVGGVDFSDRVKRVITSGGDYYGKSVIIATGASPRRLGLDMENVLVGKGIHYCAHCDGRFYKNKTVIVVGGGNSAVSDALYLSRLAKKVYIVHRRNKLKATKIYHAPLMKADNVEIIFNSTLKNFIYGERIEGAVINNTLSGESSELACDGIFISIGREPATDFLKDSLLLDDNKYIIADETTKTSAEGVFAAGDVRTKALRQIVTAVSDGAVAVHFAEDYLTKSFE